MKKEDKNIRKGLYRPACAVWKLHTLFREIQQGKYTLSVGDEIRFKKIADDDYHIYMTQIKTKPENTL